MAFFLQVGWYLATRWHVKVHSTVGNWLARRTHRCLRCSTQWLMILSFIWVTEWWVESIRLTFVSAQQPSAWSYLLSDIHCLHTWSLKIHLIVLFRISVMASVPVLNYDSTGYHKKLKPDWFIHQCVYKTNACTAQAIHSLLSFSRLHDAPCRVRENVSPESGKSLASIELFSLLLSVVVVCFCCTFSVFHNCMVYFLCILEWNCTVL